MHHTVSPYPRSPRTRPRPGHAINPRPAACPLAVKPPTALSYGLLLLLLVWPLGGCKKIKPGYESARQAGPVAQQGPPIQLVVHDDRSEKVFHQHLFGTTRDQGGAGLFQLGHSAQQVFEQGFTQALQDNGYTLNKHAPTTYDVAIERFIVIEAEREMHGPKNPLVGEVALTVTITRHGQRTASKKITAQDTGEYDFTSDSLDRVLTWTLSQAIDQALHDPVLIAALNPRPSTPTSTAQLAHTTPSNHSPNRSPNDPSNRQPARAPDHRPASTLNRSTDQTTQATPPPQPADDPNAHSTPLKAQAPPPSVATKHNQPPRDDGIGRRWAIVVGVSRYKDHRIPSLRYAARDAQLFHEWLTSAEGGRYSPAHTKLLLDDQATFRNIKHALFQWLGRALEEDMVTIYFSGHGTPQSPDAPQNLFLVPHDADYDHIAVTGFPMWDIETALKRFIKAKKVVVIADACHAGGVGVEFAHARRAIGVVENRISESLQSLSRVNHGVAVITSAGPSQLSREGKQWGGGHGVFTHFLLQGLKGHADYNHDQRVTLGELIPYLSEQVRRETRSTQSPEVSGKFDPALSLSR